VLVVVAIFIGARSAAMALTVTPSNNPATMRPICPILIGFLLIGLTQAVAVKSIGELSNINAKRRPVCRNALLYSDIATWRQADGMRLKPLLIQSYRCLNFSVMLND
jgi:hypothetical protein